MQTITTRYFGATNFRGARIKAMHTAGAHTVTIPYDYALSSEGNHRLAAASLATKLDWHGEWVGGCLDARGNVYVLVTGETIDGFRVDEQRKAA